MSKIKDGSFTARLYIDGYPLTCRIGFQTIENSTYYAGHPGAGAGQSFPTLKYVTTNHLCANTCANSIAVLFHFEHMGKGDYTITSRDSNFFPGYYLGITTDAHVNAYESKADKNDFSFKKNEKYLTLDDIPENGISGLEMICKDGGIELHNKVEYEPSGGKQWAAFVRTMSGNLGLVGKHITLKVEERNVE